MHLLFLRELRSAQSLRLLPLAPTPSLKEEGGRGRACYLSSPDVHSFTSCASS